MNYLNRISLLICGDNTNYNPILENIYFKGALAIFSVMCKIIAHSSQSRLLYVLAKFQGLTTNRTRATINFLRLFKTRNYFCGIVVCDVIVR